MPRGGPRGERRPADVIGAANKTGHSQIQNGPRGHGNGPAPDAPRRPSTEAAGRSNDLAVAKAAKAHRFQCSQA
jgi:hypothetical protein